MRNWKAYLVAAAALVLVGVIGVALTPHPAAAAGSAPVTVVNTPLPVTGSITGTVAVGDVVQVQDVDNPARHAWQKSFSGFINSYTVPDGERLTIEFASLSCVGPASSPPRPVSSGSVTTTVGGAAVSHFLPTNFEGNLNATMDGYVGAHQVRIYADPGTDVVVFTTGTGVSSCAVVLSGYLIEQ